MMTQQKPYKIPVSLSLNGTVEVLAGNFDSAYDIVDAMITNHQVNESNMDVTDQHVQIDENRVHECDGYAD